MIVAMLALAACSTVEEETRRKMQPVIDSLDTPEMKAAIEAARTREVPRRRPSG